MQDLFYSLSNRVRNFMMDRYKLQNLLKYLLPIFKGGEKWETPCCFNWINELLRFQNHFNGDDFRVILIVLIPCGRYTFGI